MFGLETGTRKLWYCRATNKEMLTAVLDGNLPVQIEILLLAPNCSTAQRYADALCGGDPYHSELEEVKTQELFAKRTSAANERGRSHERDHE